MKTMFVAFSHTLTAEQIEDARVSLGVERIISLKDINPELQGRFSSVPADASLEDIQLIAAKICRLAHDACADYFFCTGEPTLMLWCNIYAEGTLIKPSPYKMTCVSSTTKRVSQETVQADGTILKTAVFKHVQWRKMFNL